MPDQTKVFISILNKLQITYNHIKKQYTHHTSTPITKTILKIINPL